MGELLAVVATALFSFANISIGRIYRGTAARGGALLSMLMTFCFSAVVWLFVGWRSELALPSQSALGWFVLAGVLTAFVGRVFLFESIRYLGAVRGSAIKRLNPMFSVILGVLLLGEVISLPMAVGIGLIAASFIVLIQQSLQAEAQAGSSSAASGTLNRVVNLGYLHGPVSAFAYALGYVARKQGLLEMPDAVLGTMVGAAAGGVCFCLLAIVVTSMRAELHRTFTEFRPWLWLAGLFTSVGQLLYFAALNYSSISKIALITSMEVFVTMFLSRLVLRGEEPLPREVLIAASLGVLGTMLVIRY
jgi:drug/metabolite transporter (DMT)-like permease